MASLPVKCLSIIAKLRKDGYGAWQASAAFGEYKLQAPMEHIEKQFLSQKHQSLLSSSGFTLHIQLPKSTWIAWFERHLFPYFFGSQDDPLVFPIIRPHRTTCLCTHNVKGTKHGFQVTALPQSACRLSQGGSTELAALQNVSAWRRTPWNAVPEMAVAPANLVTKATDAREVQSDDKFSYLSNNNAQLWFSTLWSLISYSTPPRSLGNQKTLSIPYLQVRILRQGGNKAI